MSFHWLTKSWWMYLLARPALGTNRLRAFWCRMRGHRPGVYWYNTSGLEPDMHCRGCGDNLG